MGNPDLFWLYKSSVKVDIIFIIKPNDSNKNKKHYVYSSVIYLYKPGPTYLHLRDSSMSKPHVMI